ncbi:MAG TPA: serine/threonine-protein kinase [Bryobacteraceae bacterium]|jgi:serine/threonine-protein kinase
MEGTLYSPGDRVSDYEVIEVLGAGGFGQVYKVRNTLSDRVEALKVLIPSLLGDAALTERFMREIKVQAALQHPNIASLLGVQRQDNRILMFLEYIDGVTLDKALDRNRLSPGTTAAIIAQVLNALGYAHAAGVIHRDVKPANIMIQKDGRVKLMDFGIARAGQDRKLTSTGQALGSLHYMSPEQINALPDIDGRTDLYSLGIVMYQAITGTKPFDGPSDYSIMAGHLSTLPTPPIALDGSVPRMINDVVLRAVEKNRDLRFQSAQEFRQALDYAMNGQYPMIEIAMAPTSPSPTASAPTVSMSVPVPPSADTVPTVKIPHAPPQYAPTVSQNFYQGPPQQQSAVMNTLTQHALRTQYGWKSPVSAGILGFFISWAGALYVGKSAMAFLLFCAEIAVGTVGCAASCSSRHGTGMGGWLLFEIPFHCFTAWQCFKWATLRNAQLGMQPMPPQQMYRQ